MRAIPGGLAGLLLLTAAAAMPALAARSPSLPQPPAVAGSGQPDQFSGKAGGLSGEAQRRDLLDGLFARLYLAEDEKTAVAIAGSIRELLARPESASAQVLMMQAERALKADQPLIARHLLDLLTRRWPAFADGWFRRGVARFMMDDLNGALADLDRALALEPRHFEALMTKAAILEELKRLGEAREAYERVLAIYPRLPAARDALKALKLKLDQRI